MNAVSTPINHNSLGSDGLKAATQSQPFIIKWQI